MEINRTLEKYQEVVKLQEKIRKGIIKKEDLSYKELIMLCRLYDIQINNLELENEKNLDKINKYRKKLSRI